MEVSEKRSNYKILIFHLYIARGLSGSVYKYSLRMCYKIHDFFQEVTTKLLIFDSQKSLKFHKQALRLCAVATTTGVLW